MFVSKKHMRCIPSYFDPNAREKTAYLNESKGVEKIYFYIGISGLLHAETTTNTGVGRIVRTRDIRACLRRPHIGSMPGKLRCRRVVL